MTNAADDPLFARPDRERRRLWAIAAVLVAVTLAFLLWPAAKKALRPELAEAFVAIEPSSGPDAGIATVGRVELEAGAAFLLRAVLAAGEGEQRIYFTDAKRLRVGGAEVPHGRLRRWSGPEVVRVLWFTVEGYRPVVKLEPGETLDRFRFAEFFQPDWPREWTVAGLAEPRNDDHLAARPGREWRGFGTQRYHARVELFANEKTQIPMRRFSSWGPSELPARAGANEFPTVVLALPGRLRAVSAAFGLTAIVPSPDADAALLGALERMSAQGLVGWNVALLAATLAERGLSADAVTWRSADLAGSVAWVGGEEEIGGERVVTVRRGALVRVGARVVLLYEDRGVVGRLDGEDLCVDLEEGVRVLALGQVFPGSGLAEIAVEPAG